MSKIYYGKDMGLNLTIHPEDLMDLGPTTLYPDELKKVVMRNITNAYYGVPTFGPTRLPRIKKVIFNEPATIIFWSDGTKTVVKASEDDEFDPEKGMAMAIAKKALQDQGKPYYHKIIKKWTDAYYKQKEVESNALNLFQSFLKKRFDSEK